MKPRIRTVSKLLLLPLHSGTFVAFTQQGSGPVCPASLSRNWKV